MSADLLVEGDGPLTATRTWAAGAELATGVAVTKAKGGKAKPLEAHGWNASLATFRPFLSYNEMGSLLEDGPSALYDALSTVLGPRRLRGGAGAPGRRAQGTRGSHHRV